MTIRAKIIALFVLIIGVFFSLSLWSHQRLRHANERLELVNQLFLPLSRQATQLQGHLQGMVDDIRRNIAGELGTHSDGTFARVVRDLYPFVIQKRLGSIERLLVKFQSVDLKLTEDLLASVSRVKNDFDLISKASNRTDFEGVIIGARNNLSQFSRRVEDESQRVVQSAQAEGKEAALTTLSLSIFVLCFGLFALYLSCRAINPLPSLIDSIKKLGSGDLDQSLKVRASDQDEIAILAREYNRMLGALRDRDKKIASQQAELLQSERLATIGQLSAEVVHEIRNPLNAINLNIDWLANELRDADSEISKTLQSVSREIERLHQITESYLVRSRVTVAEENKAPVNEIWKEIVDFERNSGGSQICIDTKLSTEEIFVRTDRSKLKQAFLNILKNAKEAMPRGGTIRVITECAHNISRVLVEDTGCGMNELTLKKTFSPFFTTKPNGTGIGLTLTKQIVEEAQGTLSCESALGKGTTFVFQFPVYG